MMLVRRSLGFAFDFVGVAAWSLAAFVVVANLVSPAVGAVLAVGIFVAASGWTLKENLNESRLSTLTAGACPRCRASIASEHRHRRWEPSRDEWLAPQTSWECGACGYAHEESWACANCPTAT